ncbi:MAG: hypothetical protein H0T79_06910 [Deltaproteobacteria bacterium]|nr:hypothetical protein [Deltaproteobacteria bacterium]
MTIALAVLVGGACGPGRTTYARYPGATPTFDRATSTAPALEVADKVLAAAGGQAGWDRAKQIRWKQTVTLEGTVRSSGEHAWDRWNARHYARLDRPEGGGVSVMYDFFGDFNAAYTESASGIRQMLPSDERAAAITIARKAWGTDANIMCMPFLLEEPGTKLEYVDVVRDGEAAYHHLKVTFDAKDTARTGLVFHVFVDQTSNLIYRVELERGGGERIGYLLQDWTTVDGLKFPAVRKNIGSGEIVTAKELTISEPQDSLFMAQVK